MALPEGPSRRRHRAESEGITRVRTVGDDRSTKAPPENPPRATMCCTSLSRKRRQEDSCNMNWH